MRGRLHSLVAGVIVSIAVLLVLGRGPASAGTTVSVNDTRLVATQTRVALTDEFFGGRTRAIKIELTGDRPDRQAFLVLLIDKDDKIWQVNLTLVVPGQTTTRTIVWKPDELQHFAAGYAYNGQRLRLRAQGTLNEPSPPLTMAWDVDIDAPVVDVRTKR